MIRGVLWICWVAFVVGAFAMHAASRKLEHAERRRRWTKFVTYFLVVNLTLLCAASGRFVFMPWMAIVVMLGAREILRALRPAIGERDSLTVPVCSAYVVASACLLAFAWSSSRGEAVYTYLVVAFFDGFSQISGQLAGRHRLARTLSPGKTVEGALGGLVMAVVGGILLRHLVGFSLTQSSMIACALAVAALIGDLAASWVKRRRGVKDFGNLLPGHGGVLDRFDSLFGAAPVSLLLFHVLR